MKTSTSTKTRTSSKATASLKSSASVKAGASVKPTSPVRSAPVTSAASTTTGASVPEQRGTQPSSLTRPGARSGAVCPSCGSQRLTTLSMTLTDGTPVSFSSCHNCEHRIWSDDAGRLDFADVLTRATKRKAS